MNQILFTNNENNNNNNFNKIDTRKIIKFFGIAVLVIALIIVSIKLIVMYKNRTPVEENDTPTVSIIRENEETKEVTIKATCKDGIQYLVYTWNDEAENRVNLNGSTSFERIIEIPENTINNLSVEVVSIKGVRSSATEMFEKAIDNEKPSIDSITIVDKKLNIQVSDDNGIEYLSYRWENEEEVRVDADPNDNKTMSLELDIQRGTYKLWLTVVDIYNNEETLSRLITGVNEPEISAIKYGGIVHVTVTHDMGFEQIEFIINKRKYVYNENFSGYDSTRTTVEYEFPLDEGENLVQINAYSLEKLSEDGGEELENYAFKTFLGKCTYEP